MSQPAYAREATLALALALLAAALNAFPLPLGAGVNFVLGNFAFVLAAFLLRPPLALLCAAIGAAPLWLLWGHPGGWMVFCAEATCVSMLRLAGRQPFYADLIFWALIGMPLTAVLARLISVVPADYLFAITIKQAVNGAVCSSIAGLIEMLAGSRLRGWLGSSRPPRVSLRSRLVYVMTMITALSLSASALVSARSTVRYHEALIRASLDETSTHLARRVEGYVRNHALGVELLAEMLTRSPARQSLEPSLLLEFHRRFPGFLTMLVADASGAITTTAPAERMQSIAAGVYPSVADRPYFAEALRRGGSFVSEVFRGRGFGSEPIVAISCGIRDGVGGPALGIVEGSLDLGGLAEIAEPRIPGRRFLTVLVDNTGRILHASPSLRFTAMELLDGYRSAREAEGRDVLAFDSGDGRVEFIHKTVELDNGWRLMTLVEYSAVIRQLTLQYGSTCLLIVAAILLAALLAERTGQRVTAPLEQLAAELSRGRDGDVSHRAPADPDATREIALVREEMQRSFAEIERHSSELESQVAERTRELEEANNLLQALASVDALTGIGNRRVIEERFPLLRAGARRSGARIAVVVVDLDHFKNLNDRHGHLAGDQCLIEVALLLQAEFGRQTDIVARFGGEEFVIAVDCRDSDAVSRKLESVRERIEGLRIGAGVGSPLQVTASFGALVAGAEYHAQFAEWMRVADRCLYQAKEQGRNRVVIEALS